MNIRVRGSLATAILAVVVAAAWGAQLPGAGDGGPEGDTIRSWDRWVTAAAPPDAASKPVSSSIPSASTFPDSLRLVFGTVHSIEPGDPAPQPGDRILFDVRTSLQNATTNAAARALFDRILWEPAAPYGWSLATDFDGSGRNAMRGALPGRGANCGDGGEGQFVINLATPHPSKLYIQYRMYLGRHPRDAGATVGAVNYWQIKNLIAAPGACGLVGKKEIYVDRDDGGRLDHDWFSGNGWREPGTNWQWVGNGSLRSLSRWSVDAMAGHEVVYTVYYDASRPPGIIRQWVNGVQVGQIAANLGSTTFKRVRISNVFSDPGEDMTRYIWDVVIWEPQS